MNNLLKINPDKEEEKIISFIKETFNKQKIIRAVIGVSGGVDSATSLSLLSKAISLENISVLYLPYFDSSTDDLDEMISSVGLDDNQLFNISIEETVDALSDELEVPDEDLVRKGNIMARIRMIALYDFAKKNNALVVGTENKSEYLLGYFTRFGDEASDIEPIRHLYKTQVIELARHLGLPNQIINKAPSANLWEDQTDESEFGFSYAEADPVLYRFFDKNEPIGTIEKEYKNAHRIIDFAKKNSYKHLVPYHL